MSLFSRLFCRGQRSAIRRQTSDVRRKQRSEVRRKGHGRICLLISDLCSSGWPLPQTGKDVSVAGRQRVLVVDGPWETEEVLKAVLEPRGLHVERVRGGPAPHAGRNASPARVVVIHGEEHPDFQDASGSWGDTPRVIIGSADQPNSPTEGESVPRGVPSQNSDPPAEHHHLPFPFQYRDLIQTVERLLAAAEEC